MYFVAGGAASAQTLTTGDIVGKITDPSGAALANATVTLKSLDQGTVQTVKTDTTGSYRFPLLRPGSYSISEDAMNLRAKADKVEVNVGQQTMVDLVATASGASEAVEVLATQPLLQAEDANITTTFSQMQMQDLPLAGADLTSTALTAPGVVLATGGGLSSNFFAFGLPGTGNLFVMNGADLMDPYYNINNSGASNNSLGINEVQETSVVSNGYTGQYGRLPGATVTYVTKSGGNQFHGNALYAYNGSFLNARDWFVAHNATPDLIAGGRPRTIANEWGGSIGGPILKNRLFGFFDDEGLRYVSAASSQNIYVPTAAFQSAVLANVTANQPNEVAFYKQIFSLYNGANGAAGAVPTTATSANDPTNGCNDFAGKLGGTNFGPTGASCSNVFSSTNNNLNTEQLYTIRVDQNIGDKDHAFYRYQHDFGVQATGTDPINTAFSANSVQPEWNGQFNENHIFSSSIVNSFTFAGSYYKAIFGPPNYAAAIAAFPTTIAFPSFTQLGGSDNQYPSGRNVAQYQFVDDLSITHGRNNMKLGVNFRRNNFALFYNQVGTTGLTSIGSVADFVNGTMGASSSVAYSFPVGGAGEMRFYSLGLYFQDQLSVNDTVKLSLSLRADRNSNPVCKHNCFARLNAPFYALANKGATTPYNQSILSGQANPYASVETVNIQPRVGFAITPAGSGGKTVIRGGVGYFIDSPLLAAVTRFFTAAPLDPSFTLFGSGTQSIQPSQSNSLYQVAKSSDTAFANGFASGATLGQLSAAVIAAGGAGFSAPSYAASIVSELKNPTYIEYNLEVQRQFGRSDAIDIDYVGNYGYDILFQDGTENAASPIGFAGLPTTRPDPRFTAVTTLTNRAHSNYSGVTTSYQHQVGSGLTVAANYTYSKTMGTVSNGGLYGANAGVQTDSVLQIDPTSPSRLNYGPLDYDVRHNISMNYDWNIKAPGTGQLIREALGGWTISGVLFYKTGTPYSVYNTLARTGALGSSTPTTSYVLAGFLGGSKTAACNKPSDVCLSRSQFAGYDVVNKSAPQAVAQAPYGFGNLATNSFRGPHFFNTDVRVLKGFKLYKDRYEFRIGGTASNVLNHPNFATPVNNVTTGTFGTIQQTVVSSPSSLYGNGQGSSPSGRVLALNAGFTF